MTPQTSRLDLPRSSREWAAPVAFPGEQLLRWQVPEQVGQYTLIGRSRAAEGTGFFIPELKWALDAGVLAHPSKPEHVFITHTHTDHIHQLIYMKTRAMPPNIYVPASMVEIVERFLRVAQELTDGAPLPEGTSYQRSYDLHGVEPGDSFRIKRGGGFFEVEVVGCEHRVPCVGYRFSDVRKKLKAEFLGFSNQELAQLRHDGVEITEERNRPLFVFMGDTRAEVFHRHPELLCAPLVITECSFLDAELHKERARRTGHTVWEELAEIVEAHPHTTFVLTHFSLRYGEADIRGFFEALELPNVVLWI